MSRENRALTLPRKMVSHLNVRLIGLKNLGHGTFSLRNRIIIYKTVLILFLLYPIDIVVLLRSMGKVLNGDLR